MDLRCFLFTSDEETAETIGQVLATLEVEVEFCAEAVSAAETISKQPFHIVIIDWDNQPEAALLLTAARERKASERPITLAIVSDDSSVPKALQAGANSILRKPAVVSQIKDTLTTARDLVRTRIEPSPAAMSAKAAAGGSAPLPRMEQKTENTLRSGEFLQSGPVAPGGSFVTEADVPVSLEQGTESPIDPLKDLEPVAASVAQEVPPPPHRTRDEPRGLEWYLKARGVTRQSAPAPAPPPPPRGKPELLSYDQTPAPPKPPVPDAAESGEHKKEAELFAYIEGERPEDETPRRGFRLGKGAIFTAFLLASIAVAAAPQAPWHPQMRAFLFRGQRALHAWLNPQPVTTAPTPAAHESFARPGDEYKLPVAEAIPDATTDPSQIQVLPVIDPTAKKPSTDPVANPDPAAVQPAQPAAPGDQSQSAPIQVKETPPQPATEASPAAIAPAIPSAVTTAPPVTAPAHSDTPVPTTSNPAPAAAPRVQSPPRQPTMPGNIPQSIRSQMAPSTPDPGGFKRPDAALPSIEPVSVSENEERALLISQPPAQYPATAKGQQGTVVLQVLIGRDGTVQDAKFLQGSLAFARAAIEGVKQWRFKPYAMNGRPVSVQTTLSITFRPGS